MTALSFQTTVTGAVAVIALAGELDVAGSELVEREIERVASDHGARAVVIDLSRLEFMDSTGLRLVVLAEHRARGQGRRFALVRGNDDVQRVFEVTGMDQRLHFVSSVEELG